MEFLSHYLVDHPSIQNFEWDPPHSPSASSSLSFLLISVASYLSATLILSLLRIRIRIRLPSKILKPISAVHSLILSILSLIMAVGCALSIHATTAPSPHDALFCLPRGTHPQGPLFFWAHVFYLSKLLEFGDTLLILLGGSTRRLSFLHVYHHAAVLLMCRLWLSTRQSLFPVALLTNASVHVLMYAYYFLCAIGIRPAWKRIVTDCQIVQFVFSFLVSGRMLYLHFTDGSGQGCSGIWGWCFNAAFNASLLALFFDFHSKSYKKTKVEESSPTSGDQDNNKVKDS